MLEEIKKEFEKRFCKHNQISPYDWNHWEADYNVPIDVSAKMVWQFIEQKLTEAIKQAKIEENEMWLAHANRFSNDVPNSLKRINRSELKDRINELKGE